MQLTTWGRALSYTILTACLLFFQACARDDSPPQQQELTDCALLGGCDMNLPITPLCNCYLNPDCVGGGVGFRVCIVKKGQCRDNSAPGRKTYDGMCTFFWWAGLVNYTDRNLAADAMDSYFKAFEMAGVSGGEPDLTLIEKARSIDIAPKGRETVEKVAMNSLILLIGRAEYDDDNPHRRGYFHFPVITSEDPTTSTGTLSYAWVDPMHESVLTGLGHVRKAIVAQIREPDEKRFSESMDALRNVVPELLTFGRCEYPHPPVHGHEFVYDDGIDCLSSELAYVFAALNDLGSRAQVPE